MHSRKSRLKQAEIEKYFLLFLMLFKMKIILVLIPLKKLKASRPDFRVVCFFYLRAAKKDCHGPFRDRTLY